MLILKLAFRNILRNRRRSLSMSEGSYSNIINTFTQNHTGHVQIHQENYLERPSLYKTINHANALIANIEQQEAVMAVAPRIYGLSLAFWFESAYMDWQQDSTYESQVIDKIPDNTLASATSYSNNYWRTSIGTDYALNKDIILMFEYHYNGAGSNYAEQYHKLVRQAPYQKAGVYLYGQHYLIPALSWLASSLVSISVSTFYNVSDNSMFVTVSSETNWSDNIYSDLGIYISHGNKMQYQQSVGKIEYVFGSEFGAYPFSIYASLRYYF